MSYKGEINTGAGRIRATLAAGGRRIGAALSAGGGKMTGHVVQVLGAEPYVGATDVTPATHRQTLETAGKLLSSDINVYPIPYAEVSNNFGGKTVTIGG